MTTTEFILLCASAGQFADDDPSSTKMVIVDDGRKLRGVAGRKVRGVVVG